MDQIPKKKKKKKNRRRRQINKQVSHTYLIFFSYFVSALCTFHFAVLWCHGPFGRTAQSRKKKTIIKTIAENLLSLKMPVVATLECTRERNPSRYETNSKQSAQRWCRWVCQTNTHILFLSLKKQTHISNSNFCTDIKLK
jgi:magnesium-transporting ATPase (P-type)